jgi:hypothetical protein
MLSPSRQAGWFPLPALLSLSHRSSAKGSTSLAELVAGGCRLPDFAVGCRNGTIYVLWHFGRSARISGRQIQAPQRSVMNDCYFQNKKETACKVYFAQSLIHSPFFNEDIDLNAEGFRHLSRAAHGERTRKEQIRRFILHPLGLQILKTATTLQAYRERAAPVGVSGQRGRRMVQWWGFVALFERQDISVHVVVRKVGGGRLHFWSVMLDTKRYRLVTPKHSARNNAGRSPCSDTPTIQG